MHRVEFDNKSYYLVDYERDGLTRTDDKTLDYISQTLYGDISITMRCVINDEKPHIFQYVRSVKENSIENKWNSYSILNQEITPLNPISVESNGGINFTFVFPTFKLNDFGIKLTENNFVTLCYESKKPMKTIRVYLEDNASELGMKNKYICYQFRNQCKIESFGYKFFEVGSFARCEDGVKFFPNTKIATLFQDGRL